MDLTMSIIIATFTGIIGAVGVFFSYYYFEIKKK